MIVGNRKDFVDIVGKLGAHRRVLVLGCNECVTVCGVGGEREVGVLAAELRIYGKTVGEEYDVREHTLERQCDYEYIEQIRGFADDYDVIVSMACGAGVQYVAEAHKTKRVIPAVNTTFLGVTLDQGVWSERCQGCGSCILDMTAGVCPIARCAKSLLNGPCGGSSGGKCEIDKDTDCAWQLIVDRLRDSGRMEQYDEILPIRDWRSGRDGGPRKRLREDLKL
jgi:ferredoxin